MLAAAKECEKTVNLGIGVENNVIILLKRRNQDAPKRRAVLIDVRVDRIKELYAHRRPCRERIGGIAGGRIQAGLELEANDCARRNLKRSNAGTLAEARHGEKREKRGNNGSTFQSKVNPLELAGQIQ